LPSHPEALRDSVRKHKQIWRQTSAAGKNCATEFQNSPVRTLGSLVDG
jgi:hypothetical protein